MFSRYDKKMNGSMGADVLKDDQRLIPIYKIGWFFSSYDLTEGAICLHRIGGQTTNAESQSVTFNMEWIGCHVNNRFYETL
jgi:hypothetical protein